MKLSTIFLGILLIPLALLSTSLADNAGRIYGKIYLVDGDEFEGLIRWDKNEGNWVDILHGTKDLDRRHRYRNKHDQDRRHRRRSRVKIFGLEFSDRGSHWGWFSSASAGIRFGHIRTLEVVDDDRVLLTLKSGEDIELEGGSTDIGTSVREIIVEDSREGEIELDWEDIDRIEFQEARGSRQSSFGERLYGTLETRRGEEFTGFVCWDVDELFTNDILDGDDRRRSRKVEFGKIASIERYSSSAARILLKSGDEMVLRGSNDVDDDNRGISIADPGFGQVTVEWDDFDKLTFSKVPRAALYDDFDGGRQLRGTVFTEDGDEYTGTIRWDDDEEFTWEILNGEYRGIEYDIEFGFIKEIERKSYHSAIVTLVDGRVFRLSDSNDVDEDNKGIIITTSDNDEIYVDWQDFTKVQFAGR